MKQNEYNWIARFLFFFFSFYFGKIGKVEKRNWHCLPYILLWYFLKTKNRKPNVAPKSQSKTLGNQIYIWKWARFSISQIAIEKPMKSHISENELGFRSPKSQSGTLWNHIYIRKWARFSSPQIAIDNPMKSHIYLKMSSVFEPRYSNREPYEITHIYIYMKMSSVSSPQIATENHIKSHISEHEFGFRAPKSQSRTLWNHIYIWKRARFLSTQIAIVHPMKSHIYLKMSSVFEPPNCNREPYKNT